MRNVSMNRVIHCTNGRTLTNRATSTFGQLRTAPMVRLRSLHDMHGGRLAEGLVADVATMCFSLAKPDRHHIFVKTPANTMHTVVNGMFNPRKSALPESLPCSRTLVSTSHVPATSLPFHMCDALRTNLPDFELILNSCSPMMAFRLDHIAAPHPGVADIGGAVPFLHHRRSLTEI